jgi:hypothetical protein
MKKMKNLNFKYQSFFLVLALSLSVGTIKAQDKPEESAADLAKKLSNPIASIISVPLQNNLDVGIGEYNGTRNTLNLQPVIPFSLSTKWNLITRTILPIVTQQDISAPGQTQSGLSDAVVSAWLSPSEAKNGLTWGVGPAFLVPTATDKLLGTEKFGIGPTVILLQQTNGWTYGALMNQLWSIAGNDDRADVNQMFIQPFLVYNWKSGAGANLILEITENWEAKTTQVTFIPSISAVTKFGKQIVQFVIGPRIPLAGPSTSRPDFGVRAGVSFVFPK